MTTSKMNPFLNSIKNNEFMIKDAVLTHTFINSTNGTDLEALIEGGVLKTLALKDYIGPGRDKLHDAVFLVEDFKLLQKDSVGGSSLSDLVDTLIEKRSTYILGTKRIPDTRSFVRHFLGLSQSTDPPRISDDDHVAVPRGLLASAYSAIDKKREAPNTLAELRRYTTGDLSFPVTKN